MRPAIVLQLAALPIAGCGFGASSGPPGSVSISPGFAPDPMIRTGRAGGEIDSASFGSDCIGHVARSPDHILMVEQPLPYLRIIARGSEDLTLVMRRPDGTFVCNDDYEARMPMLEGQLAAGTHQVFVGSYAIEARSTPYSIGFTTDRALQPSALPPP